MNTHIALLAIAVSFAFVACGPPPAPEVEPEMEAPKESEVAGESEYCKPVAGEYAEDPAFMEAGETEEFYWGEGGACVKRPIDEVWAVFHNQPLLVWKDIDRSNHEAQPPSEENATHLYRVHYEVDKIFTVEWDMEWTHKLVKGTLDDPEVVTITWNKVDGTRYIPYWKGTVQLEKLSDGVTGISVRNQISASQTDEEEAGATVTSMVEKARTGEPMWDELKGNATEHAAPEPPTEEVPGEEPISDEAPADDAEIKTETPSDS